MDSFTPVHVMIMENCLPKIPEYDLHHVFDMKGSEFSREVLKKLSINDLKGRHTGGTVLKDLDFNRLKALRGFISLSDEQWKGLTERIAKDTALLRNLRYMDYSLLLSISRVKEDEWKVE